MRIVGIDPGLTGAIALLINGKVSRVTDIPITSVAKKNGGVKRRVNSIALRDILADFKPDLVIIEDVHSRPFDGGVAAFSFGNTVGKIQAVVELQQYRVEYVSPQVWKRQLDVPADKVLASKRASAILCTKEFWPQKKDHNRAEAALIAHWGKCKHNATV